METPFGQGFVPDSFAGAAAQLPPGTLAFDVAYPEQLSQLLIFIKWLLIIPHGLVLYFLGIAAAVVALVAWFAILFTGQYPEGMWRFSLKVQRWNTNVLTYMLLMRDEYPPFAEGPYPVRYEIRRPPRSSRLLLFVRWFLVIPHLFVLWFLVIGAYVVTFIAWFAILITGRYPQGMFEFMVGYLRWVSRITLYLWMLTDTYPPFSLD